MRITAKIVSVVQAILEKYEEGIEETTASELFPFVQSSKLYLQFEHLIQEDLSITLSAWG